MTDCRLIAARQVVHAREALLWRFLQRHPVPPSLQPELNSVLLLLPAVLEGLFSSALLLRGLRFVRPAPLAPT